MKSTISSIFLQGTSVLLAGLQTITVFVPIIMVTGASLPKAYAETENVQPRTVIRRAPVQEPRSILPHFSSPPTGDEFFSVQVLPVALVPVGSPTAEENLALAAALTAYVQRTNSEDQSILSGFLEKYPNSAWNPALLVNLGILWRQNGYFSRAKDAWAKAWSSSKEASEHKAKALADRAVGELSQFYAWIGAYDKLEPLFAEVGDRKLIGNAAEMLASSRDGLVVMNNIPDSGFLCGPYALQQILASYQPGARSSVLVDAKSTRQGVSLTQLKLLADAAGMHLQIAKRTSGEFILNSVIHWKLNHYGALLKEENGRYLVRDATFSRLYGQQMWISKAALEEESDGYFLVPEGLLPSGWEKCSVEEGKNIWGKGAPTAKDPDSHCKTCPPGSVRAMAGYQMTLMLAGLYITDIPLFYEPPVGPAVEFSIAYNQRDSFLDAVPNYSNLGAQWSFDWFTYIADNGTSGGRTTVNRYLNSVGQITETISNPTTGLYLSDRFGCTLQYNSGSDSYTLTYGDGSQEVFGYPNTLASGPRKMFLTKKIDPAGNALSFYYDSHGRLSYVNDAIGQSTTLFYDSVADIYKITRIEDPFGRFVYFQYDGQERLQKITDQIGLTSAFTYDTASFVTELTTAYGVTKFSYGQDGATGARWLYATDPNGDHEYVFSPALADDTASIANNSSDSIPPTSVGGSSFTLNGYRNTFHFDKAALSIGTTNNFANATVYHWLHDNDSSGSVTESGILESMRRPLESRIYYWYPGQTGGSMSGGITLREPSIVARIVDNPVTPSAPLTQAYQYSYNDQGRLTQYIDPAGRTTILNYYSNGIDLRKVQQANNGGYDTLAQFGPYNSQHRPATYTNAAVMAYTLQWNAAGQLTNIINPKTEILAYNHDTNGYLKKIIQSGSGLSSTNSFGYDFYGRLNTFTNTAGYYLTAGYDSLNRVTNITYPDGTFEKYVFNKLNLFAAYDRAGYRTVWTYDGTGRPLTMRDRLNRLTQYSWCGCGGLASITDPMNHSTTWTRDVEGRVTQKIYQDSKTIQYAFENYSGRLKSSTDAKSQVKNYVYNLDNTLSNLTYTGAIISTPSVAFFYDTNYNRVVSMVDGVGTTSYGYYPVGQRGANRLMAETNAFANAITTYNYDELGRMTNRAIDGVNEMVMFDGLNRITNHVSALGSFTSSYVGSTHQLSSSHYPNQFQISYYYDDVFGDNRLLSTEAENLSSGISTTNSTFVMLGNDYSYDELGQLKETTMFRGWWVSVAHFGYRDAIKTFQYDSEGQLTDVTQQSGGGSPGKAFSYGYDGAGNRTNQQAEIFGSPLLVSKSSYNNVNQLTNRSGTAPLPVRFLGTVNEFSAVTVTNQIAPLLDTNFTFAATVNLASGTNIIPVVAVDINGNRATNKYSLKVAGDLEKSYRYDADGNCTNVSMAGTNIWYEWDAENRLDAINTYVTNTSTLQRSEFAYDGFDHWVQILEKTNGVTVSTKHFVWSGSQLCQERNSGNSVTKRFFAEGEQIAGNNYYYIRDQLGTIQQMVDSSGYIRADYDYDPYGNPTKTQGDIDADFGFAGYYRYAPTSLYLTWFRAYDADSGRWLNRDPIQEAGGINLYGYVGNNPVNDLDPMGLVNLNLIGNNRMSTMKQNREGWFLDSYNPGGVYSVGGHGDAFSILDGNTHKMLDAADLLRLMRNNGYKGGPIMLASCNTGSNPRGLAQQLANLTGYPVTAPDKYFTLDGAGHPGVYGIYPDGSINYNDPGQLNTFSAKFDVPYNVGQANNVATASR